MRTFGFIVLSAAALSCARAPVEMGVGPVAGWDGAAAGDAGNQAGSSAGAAGTGASAPAGTGTAGATGGGSIGTAGAGLASGAGGSTRAGLCMDGAAVAIPALCRGANKGAACTGRYRNLLMEAGHDRGEIAGRLELAFSQLFHGNDQQRVYFESGADTAYIKDIIHGDVRSEGISYGMMIAVQMDKRVEFDRLWRWADANIRHKSGPRSGYFAWQWASGRIVDPNPAPDGEEYMATALFLAASRWGSGTGILDYRAQANSILNAMLHKSESSPAEGLTNAFNTGNKLIVFSPIGDAATFTDPSYHVPAFYELWGQWATRDQAFWTGAAAASRAFLPKTAHPQTGLSPDYANFDGTTRGSGNTFHNDAWRVAANVGMDAAWFAVDPWQEKQSQRLLQFFTRQGGGYLDHYQLDGSTLGGYHSTGLVGMNAVAALAIPQLGTQERAFVEALWDTPVPDGQSRYYDGMLYLLGLLHISGNFCVWPS